LCTPEERRGEERRGEERREKNSDDTTGETNAHGG